MKSARRCLAPTRGSDLGRPFSLLVVGQGVIATRQLQEAVSSVLFCDFSSHSAELFGELSKVLGISEMIHLFSAFSPKQKLTVGDRLALIHIKK
jgi:hypothetical protein